ncbi:MAG TPA: alcohol dehydrogenase catalytic domain-containing protein, partial [Solirubrobacteraceae bacterium]|nr:alcohol dehydrogenase catalytic domain-containing protein [Solirubrobacteraceae bacterium]
MRAALLHGPGDLRVQDVADPEGEVLVTVEAATACATDVKCLRYGHIILGPYPARFGHETVGVRDDTGERVLVGDSLPCGSCRSCAAGRTQLCERMRWVLGGFAERIAAPLGALHAVPAGLDAAGAAMAEPLAAAVHAVARAGSAARPGAHAAVLGGGTMGLMLARLLVLAGCEVTLADRHGERRAQARAFAAHAVQRLEPAGHDLVMEAVGRPARGAGRHARRTPAPARGARRGGRRASPRSRRGRAAAPA